MAARGLDAGLPRALSRLLLPVSSPVKSPVRLPPLLLLVLLVLLGWSPPAPAQDVAAGRSKAPACAVCHGAQGLSAQPDAPSLAGQPALYLVAQLRAYRSGARRHEVMNVMAKPLSDADIADLAAWYAAIEVKVTLPP